MADIQMTDVNAACVKINDKKVANDKVANDKVAEHEGAVPKVADVEMFDDQVADEELSHTEDEASKEPRPRLKTTEKDTGRFVSIRTTTPLAILRINVHKQASSRLLQLPGELRMRIYELVFEQYPDKTRKYKPHAPYFRPGYEAVRKTNTTLLLTCRKVWLEANHLPLELATHPFWFHNGPLDMLRLAKSNGIHRKADDLPSAPSEQERWTSFFKKLTPLNFTQINHIRIFGSQAWLSTFESESTLDKYFGKDWFSARYVTITLRDAEWGFWKDKAYLNTRWLQAILNCPNIRDVHRIRLELERIDTNVEDLETAAATFSSIHGKYFQRIDEINSDQWSKQVPNNKLSKLAAAEKKLPPDVYLTRTITWQATKPHEGRRLHPRGFMLRDGELEDFLSTRQKFHKTRGRKRGGRRSLPSLYRNHFQPRCYSEADVEHIAREDYAANTMEQWTKKGPLLRLV